MKRALLLLAVLALAACDGQQSAAPTEAAKGPPLLPYQMRPEAPAGNRLAASSAGQTLFEHRCGACHLIGGMGTNLLTKQRVALGESPDKALLSNRSDLTADYVKQVVRQGKNAMPQQTKVDITDAELDAVATWLGKAK